MFKECSYAVVTAMNKYASKVLNADVIMDLDNDIYTTLLECTGKAAMVLDGSSQNEALAHKKERRHKEDLHGEELDF